MADETLGTGAEGAPSTDDINLDAALSATIEKAFDAVEAADEGDDAGGPARGPDGKFVARSTGATDAPEHQPAAAPQAGAAGGPDTAAAGEAQGAGGSPAGAGPITAPQSMSKADQENFAKLPPDLQQWMATREQQREADYTRKSQENARQGQAFAALDQVIAPHRPTFARRGMSEAQVVAELFGAAQYADRDFVGFVRDQAVRRGVPLESLVAHLTGAGGGQQQRQAPSDPALAAALERVGGIEQHLIQQQRSAQERALAGITATIEAFKAENGADGKPLRPYYADVEPELGPILDALVAQHPTKSHADLLQLAYDRATWANPTTREKLQADMKAKADADAVAKAADAAAKARKAGKANVVGTSAPAGNGGKPKTLDETLNDAYDAAMGA